MSLPQPCQVPNRRGACEGEDQEHDGAGTLGEGLGEELDLGLDERLEVELGEILAVQVGRWPGK